MLFNSYIFIFAFLPITIIGFFGLTKWHLIKYARLWMVIASLFFYAYWKPEYLPLLVISITFNYFIGHQIDRLKPRSLAAKSILLFGILINLSILGYYKYANFFVSSLNQLFQIELPKTTVILPLAISFYTFTQIAYLVDAYRGETKEENYDLITYCLFVCFFPQLIAGPILRHNELIPQFHKLRNFIFSHKKASLGLTLFILGLSKKMLIADNLSPWVASVFGNAEQVTFMEAWKGEISESFLNDLKEVVRQCREREIELKIFISPTHVTELELLRLAGLWPLVEQWKQEIVKIAFGISRATIALPLNPLLMK